MLLFLPALLLHAETKKSTGNQAVDVKRTAQTDSMAMNLNEVVVAKSMRENAFLNHLPVSSSILSGKSLEALNAQNIHSLSAYVPNLFIPDYGSKITSAVYIRGIGSRLNTSAVGFYVDNIPYLDKSAFDFELQDLQRVEVLRGPQATLYGRNSMGGLIHIHTLSPFDAAGTSLRMSYGSYNELKLELSHSTIFNPNLAFSISTNYNQTDGFEKNTFTGKSSGSQQSGGVRTKLAARFSNGWKADFSANYENSMQNGYPYAPYATSIIGYNDASSYKRDLLSTGLLLEKAMDNTVFSSMTGYQYLRDDLKLDQDFSPASIFTLNQKQKQHAITQEFVLKSKNEQPWEWVVGAFGFYRNMNTDSPVKFKQDGISGMMESNINKNIPASVGMLVDITDNEFTIPSLFTEENYSTAIYHQSTYHFQNLEGLSATVGLRLDYEHVLLDYASSSAMNYKYSMTNRGMTISDALTTDALLDGKVSKGFWQVVPKVSLQYEFNKRNRVYATLSKGYQSGGYNIQIFSDLIQTELQAVMSQQMKQSIATKLQAYVAMGMPQSQVDAIVSRIPASGNVTNIKESISYDPENSWNYELGFHSEPIEGKLQLDAALFYIDCNNRQIAMFSPNGFGRMMKNAAGSFSKGLELSVKAKPLKNVGFNASYGFTEAKFTDYTDSVRVNGVYQEVDYTNNYVPMIPRHTLSLGADYAVAVKTDCLDKIIFAAQYTASGPIYWTEKNSIKQDFYGLTDAQISFLKGDFRLNLWAKNAFNQQYKAFYFESMGSPFAQRGKPGQIGVTAQWRF